MNLSFPTHKIFPAARRTAGVAAVFLTFVAGAQEMPAGDVARGQIYFQTACAICHSPTLGSNNTVIIKQGPSLVGVMGRKAGSSSHFNYSEAMAASSVMWDAKSLFKFLENPMAEMPGTIMPMPIPDAANRADVIAYLATLKIPEGVTLNYQMEMSSSASKDPNDWPRQAPGVKHHIIEEELAAPYATTAAGNGPKVVPEPTNAMVFVPAGFTVKKFAKGLNNPRLIRTAPNGDIFIAETGRNRIRVLRAEDGADAPTVNQICIENLNRPFGISFYPPGADPQWIYVANNNSVVRFPYHNGDLKITNAPEIIVAKLSETTGGHSTRDVVFSRDGKRMFISVGSGSNVADKMEKKTSEEIQAWEAERGVGAAWGAEQDRACILVTDPEGRTPVRHFANGIRNPVGLAVHPETGDLWTSINERDGLGDNLVPDYMSRVKEGGFYGWPWYYIGNHEDPRHKGERPDLAGKVIVPDVLEQAHSASLQMTFYTASNGVAAFPSEYSGDAFAALHGSWNRNIRTGYKIVRAKLNHGVPTGAYEDFLTGFVVDDRNVWGRPVGVAVARDGALLVTDDGSGTVWRIAPKR